VTPLPITCVPLCFKGTRLRSGRVTFLKRKFWKTCFPCYVGHKVRSGLSCGTLIYILSVCNSFKICTIYVDLGKTLQRFSQFNRFIPILKPICKNNRGHIKVPQKSVNTLITLVTRKYRFQSQTGVM